MKANGSPIHHPDEPPPALQDLQVLQVRGKRQTAAALLLPLGVGLLLIAIWQAVLWRRSSDLFPRPLEVALAMGDLVRTGAVFRYAAASLFRVSVGFGLAVLIGVPLGLTLGWYRPMAQAFNPLVQVLRPISPIAWIPLAILWFGIDDTAPIFLIFLASVFPVTVALMAAVQNIPPTYLRAARNFGLGRWLLFRRVIFPATFPQLVTALRISLGIAWLVVVAAEMIAVDSGLGYLIIDARNAGKRYDLVVAGMLLIGGVGLALDGAIRTLERLESVRWGISSSSG